MPGKKKWTDAIVARHLKHAVSKVRADGGLLPAVALRESRALLQNMDMLIQDGHEVGCRAINTVMSGLCKWRLPRQAESLFKEGRALPDHLTHLILIGGFSKSKDAKKVAEYISLREKHGFPPDTECYNYYLKALQKPCEKEMRQVLRLMGTLGLEPCSSTATQAMLCCETADAAEDLRRREFADVMPVSRSQFIYLTLSARTGDTARAQHIINKGGGRGLRVVEANMLLNSFAVRRKWKECLRFGKSVFRGGRAKQARATPGGAPLLHPTPVTYATYIKACGLCVERIGDGPYIAAERLFKEAYNGSGTFNNFVLTNMMTLYANAGDAKRAEDLREFATGAKLHWSAPCEQQYQRALKRGSEGPSIGAGGQGCPPQGASGA